MFKKNVLILIISLKFIGPSPSQLYAQTGAIYNLPLVVINTNGQSIHDDPKIKVQMGLIDNGPGNLNSPADSFNIYDGWAYIERRGNSSQGFPKKSYGFETSDESGEKLNVRLLGMPEENDWVLYAPYSDKSMMRNTLIFQLSREMGNYAPRTRFCELFLNGAYTGVYSLTEKIKQDKNRINIAKLNSMDISGDELTGGYILKVDWAESGNGWFTSYSHKGEDPNSNAKIMYVDPGTDSLKSEQKNYIRDFIIAFENTLKSTGFNDPVTGYHNYINTTSFIDFILANELANNVDAYALSTFFYKDKNSKGGKLTMGPVWDFDLAFGNSDYGGYQGTFSFNDYLDPAPKWFTRLIEDPTFANKMDCRWKQLRKNILESQRVMSIIDSISSYLSDAQIRNNTRWNLYGRYIWPNNFIGENYEEEVDYLKDWINERFNWLDNNMPGNCASLSSDQALTSPQGLYLYPNPNQGMFFIRIDDNSVSELPYEIINSQGITVKTGYSSQGLSEIEMGNVPAGLYIYKLSEKDNTSCIKFLVQ